MKIVVLDAATLGADLDLSPLKTLGEVIAYPATETAEIAERIADADVIVANKAKLGAENLSGARRLALIAEAATGYDNIDLAYCRARGVAVANVAGYSTDSVAQVTVATALYLYTHLRAYTAYVDSGAYSESRCFNRLEPVYHETTGKIWGIVGYGTIGARVAETARALGCHVIAYTRSPKNGVECLTLDEVCRSADIISVHTPLTAQTRALIGRRELALMKEGCVLVNEARGAVLDEAAVVEAVLQNRIAFGCDVYATEPFGVAHPYHAILGRENVCLTPHMAWGAREARERCLSEIVENIRAFSAGVRRNRVD